MILRQLTFIFVLISFLKLVFGQQEESQSEHFVNCTINDKIYYDFDCANVFRRFFTWLGIGFLILIFLIFGFLGMCICTLLRLLCCVSEREEPTMTLKSFPNYSTMS
ncbi:hypothetical protein PVAND_007568 [Polypedilum vanderplanki]|uniref:Uncharacterized protein n=1 Tax=Polypedilum vanderplanki TaxID=319348 RepID=A0A9J6C7L1_POLVA|nr:hypothetical protein PVAND_007568 [Polypedilum vanderplanki]